MVYLHYLSLQELFKCIKQIIQQRRFHLFSKLVEIIKFFLSSRAGICTV